MANVTNNPSQDELVNWCRGEGLDVKHALLLHGVPEDTSVAEIEETVGTVKALGKVRVRGKMFHSQQQALMVLVECREEVDINKVPPQLMLTTGGKALGTVNTVAYMEAPKISQADDFTEKLFTLLQNEGKTLEDIQRLCSHREEETSDPESIIRAVGEIMGRNSKQPNSHAYRRLRTFSGISPTPAGEECFDTWMEQATILVEESGCSEKEKRRRILESLRGPTLDIIQAVRMTDPDVSPIEYIKAIESIFGTTETGEELYLSFKSLRQLPDEPLSDFLRRLEKSLMKVVDKGGIAVGDANKARLMQLIKGSTSDVMLLKLKIRERQDNPPTFLSLLKEVREEECRQSARQGQAAPNRRSQVRTVQAERGKEFDSSTENDLQAQILELKAQLAEGRNPHPPPTAGHTNNPQGKKPQKTESNSDVIALRKQVKALENTTKSLQSCFKPQTCACPSIVFQGP
ncbi:paraneoplastic antigen Ma1 homolog [Larimichthys crocea]|uniref:paraneoplastic antigen Ma1 homolog n=1 Tax=Larimichthys crocea TaxID=215358 RepID=UPI000F6022C1|nr:paraneoplastic antigen Ma1 homolog [Larimichthys crocea]